MHSGLIQTQKPVKKSRCGKCFSVITIAFIVAVFSCLAFFPSVSSAAINNKINFQGKVVNTDGTNVNNGNYDFTFSVYSVATEGSPMWTETWNIGTSQISVTDGIFQVALGTHTALPGDIDFNSNSLYLGVSFNGDNEMTPRIQFTSVPQAFNADKLDGVDSSQFLRSDQSDNYTVGTLTFDVGTTLAISGDMTIADTDIALNGATANLASTGDFSINSDDLFIDKETGNVGIGTTGPDAKLDSLATTEQLRLTYTDGSVYTSLTTNSAGQLTIAPSGAQTNITGALSVTGLATFSNTSYAGLFIRTGLDADALNTVTTARAARTGQMADGFGAAQAFEIQDADGVPNPAGQVGFVRASADNTYSFVVSTVDGGTGYTLLTGTKGQIKQGTTTTLAQTFWLSTGTGGTAAANIKMGTNTREWDIKVDASPYTWHLDYIGTDAPVTNVITALKDGKVGIGTTSPGSKLDVSGSAPDLRISDTRSATWTLNNPLGSLNFYTADTDSARVAASIVHVSDYNGSHGTVRGALQFNVSTTGAVSEAMRITSDGKVGIGTASPSYGKLQINSPTVGTNAMLSFSALDGTYNPRAIINHVTAANDQYVQFDSSYSSGSGYADWVFSNGNVGIGTTTTKGALDVSNGGATLVLGADADASSRTNVTEKQAKILFPHYTNAEEDVMAYLFRGANGANIVALGGGSASYNAATYISFWTAATSTTTTGAERMRINAAGNVGIGTTVPGSALDINGATGGVLRLTYNDADGSATDYSTLGVGDSGLTTLTTVDSDGTLGHIALMPDGNVGIGTASPATRLELSSIGEETIRISATRNSSTWAVDGTEFSGRIQFFSSDGSVNDETGWIKSYPSIAAGSIWKMGFGVAYGETANEILTLYSPNSTTDGRVGIGTADPADKLHIQPSTYGSTILGAGNHDAKGDGPYLGFNAFETSVAGTWDTVSSTYDGAVIAVNTSNVDSNTNLRFGFVDQADASESTAMVILKSGRVGIGNAEPGYLLDVSGDINTTGDIRKSGTAYNNPDYVFSAGYNLMDLSELKNYTRQFSHLPGVPSSEEISRSGVALFEQARVGLEKTEEAYLYLFDLDDRLKELTNRVGLLEKKETAGSFSLEDIIDLVMRGKLVVHGKAEFLGDVDIKGNLSRGNEQAGFAEIPKGGIEVRVEYEEKFNGNPIVNVAQAGDSVNFGIFESDEKGFVIRLPKKATENIHFSWTALTVKDPKTSKGKVLDAETEEPAKETPVGVKEESPPQNSDPKESVPEQKIELKNASLPAEEPLEQTSVADEFVAKKDSDESMPVETEALPEDPGSGNAESVTEAGQTESGI